MRKFLRDLFWLAVGLILLSAIFSTPRFAESAENRPQKIATPGETGIRVIDGDTFAIAGEAVRIATIDAPELFSPKCAAEKRLARLAKARLRALLGDGSGVTLEREPAPDRYGRTLARVLVNGKEIGETLVSENLAMPWTGKRFSWCCGAD